MKKAELTTGTLLAYRHRPIDPPAAALVLDATTLWEKANQRRGSGYTWSRSDNTRSGRPGRRGGYAGYGSTYWGYLAVIAHSTYDADVRDQRAEALLQWLAMLDDPHHLTSESVAAMAKSTPEDTRMDVIDARHLAGPWEPIASKYDRDKAAEKAERDRETAERYRLAAVHERARAAWRERFPGSDIVWDSYTSDTYNARVPLDRLAELLGERTTAQ